MIKSSLIPWCGVIKKICSVGFTAAVLWSRFFLLDPDPVKMHRLLAVKFSTKAPASQILLIPQ